MQKTYNPNTGLQQQMPIFFLIHFSTAGVPIQSNLTDSLVTRDLWKAVCNLIAAQKS